MFEISDLKSKKLPELQEIANGLKVPKYKIRSIGGDCMSPPTISEGY